MTWVSAQHDFNKPFSTWSLDEKIEVFISRVDDWHLLVADRVINGWQVGGRDCISTVVDYVGGEATFIPHSAWAALQIVLNYFETIGYFKAGGSGKKSGDHFKVGVYDVFPNFDGHNPSLSKMLYSQLRGGLYHSGLSSTPIPIYLTTSTSEPVDFNDQPKVWVINPHIFVRRLREHFLDYSQILRDKTKTDQRDRFERAFSKKYKW